MRLLASLFQALISALLFMLGLAAAPFLWLGQMFGLRPRPQVPLPPSITETRREVAAQAQKPTIEPKPNNELEIASLVRRCARRLMQDRDADPLLAALPQPLARELREMRNADLAELLREDMATLGSRISSSGKLRIAGGSIRRVARPEFPPNQAGFQSSPRFA